MAETEINHYNHGTEQNRTGVTKVTITTGVNGSVTNREPQSGQTGAYGYLNPQGMGFPWWYL